MHIRSRCGWAGAVALETTFGVERFLEFGRSQDPSKMPPGNDDDGAQCNSLQAERVGDIEGDVADGDDDAGGQRDQVDRIGEIDPVLLPDLGSEQPDHPVQDHGDSA
jgi:hypothetical protein